MTREEQIQILTEAQERAFIQIDLTAGCDMGSEDFARLIHAAEQLRWMAMPPADVPGPAMAPEEPEDDEPDDEPKKDRPKIRTERIGNQMLTEVVEPEPRTGADEPKFKMEDVRGALAKARSNGVNVSEIIRSFGVDSFPDIPAAKYPEVMKQLGAI